MAFTRLSQKLPLTAIQRFFAALVEPAVWVQDKEQQRQSRLLASLLLLLITVPLFISIVLGFVNYPTAPWTSPYLQGTFVADIFLGVAYALSRRGRNRLGTFLCIVAGSGVIFMIALTEPKESATTVLYYLIVPILFSSQFLPAEITLTISLAYLIGMIVFPRFMPMFTQNMIDDPLTFFMVASVIVLMITRYAKHLETERRAELTESVARYRLLVNTANEGVIQVNSDARIVYLNPRLTEMLNYSAEELFGKPYFDLLHPDMVAESHRRFEQRRQGIKGKRDVCFRKKDGTDVWVLVSSTPILDEQGTFKGIMSMLTDITERKLAEAAEHEMRQFAEALNEISATLTSTLDLNEVLNRILTTISKVIPHDVANILFIAGDVAEIVGHRNRLEFNQTQSLLGTRFSITETRNLREVYETGAPIIIDNIAEYPGWVHLLGVTWAQSICTIPIHLGHKVIGFIMLESRETGYFTPNHVARLKAFADYAAIAIQNARLFDQERELATTQERQRLARELHDGVNQTLFSANLIAESLPLLWQRDPELVRQQVSDLQKLTRGALAEMRTSLFEMRPDALTETPLSTLLGYLVDGLLGKTTTSVSLQVEGEGLLPPEVQINLYRVAQEGLNNIRQHARATEVLVKFSHQHERVTLTIRDNGRGFDPTACPTDHFGLQSLRERAAAIGAALQIYSAPGHGTEIQVIWETTKDTDN